MPLTDISDLVVQMYHLAKPVTCVDWHSSSPGLIASGGDDCLVKLWKPSVPESSDEESDDDEA